MDQNEMKKAVAAAAAKYVEERLDENSVIGVGTGSTANCFIECLAPFKNRILSTVASSEETRRRLMALGIPVFDLNSVDEVTFYIDGADEANAQLHLIKGGGGALTREKIIAAVAKEFVCIADESKLVPVLGKFPLPVEVIPMATRRVIQQFAAMGGTGTVRLKDGKPLVTDNGQYILDVHGLKLTEPMALEARISQWPGVVTVGIFAFQKADICLLATPDGVQTLRY